MASDSLEPIPPQEALDWYLEDRQDEVRTATRRKHATSLGLFVEWTDEAGIDNMNDVGGRQLMQFKTWRKSNSDLKTVSLNGNLAILRTFLQFCEDIEAVADGTADRVPLPNVPPDEEVADFVPDDETVEAIRDYHQRFEYASRPHVEFELVAEVGLRLGAIRAIDLEDIDTEHAQATIHLRHRPEGPEVDGTPLKNGTSGERIVNVSSRLADLIDDYVTGIRYDVEDTFGREPLFTTRSGRPKTTTIRRDFYKMTRPCVPEGGCTPEECDSVCPGAKNNQASKCPDSFSTHPLRKWSIMRQLDEGISKELLSDRVDVSVPVLTKHYDHRSKERKSRRRREALAEHLREYSEAD